MLMKKLPLPLPLLLCLSLALISCQPQQVSDTTPMKTYENARLGFSFQYPSDWKLVDLSNQPQNVYGLIAWMYTPEAAKRLEKCDEQDKSAEMLMRCGQAQADSAITVGSTIFVDYDSLEAWAKTNYPDAKKMHWPNADGFSYTTTSQPAYAAFQINNPNTQSGVTISLRQDELIAEKNVVNMAVAQKILETFTFNEK